MWTTEKVRSHGDLLFTKLLDDWEKEGRKDVPPSAFAFVTDSGEDCLIRLPGVEALPKEHIPTALRTFCQMLGIRYVALCASATVVEGLPTEEVQAWYAKGNRLADHPAAKDNLLLTIDGVGLSICMRAWWDGSAVCREVIDNHGAVGPMTNLSGRMGEN